MKLIRLIRVLLRHPLAGAAVRYGVAGATVGVVYLSIPLLLNTVLGIPIEVVIPIAYLVAVTLHFNLQRHFVFRHVDAFALSVRGQIGRYIAIGAIQYPTTALATAFLPGLLGVDERVMFVIITLSMSGVFFLLLRGHVFHPNAEEELAAEQRAAALAVMQTSEPANRAEPDPAAGGHARAGDHVPLPR